MHSILSPRLFIQLLNSIGSNTNLEKLNSRPAAKFNFEQLTITLSAWQFSQFSTHLVVHWSRPYLINKDVLGDCDNALLESGRWYHAQSSPLINYASCFIMEASQVGQAWFILSKSMLSFLNHFLFLCVPLNSFYKDLFYNVPRAWINADRCVFSGSSTLSFLEMGVAFAPFPVIYYLWSPQPCKDETVALQWCQPTPRIFGCMPSGLLYLWWKIEKIFEAMLILKDIV